MADKLRLLNGKILLQERYDNFVRWITSKNHSIPELIAQDLGVPVSVVDVFFQLGRLDDDEFPIIDSCQFDVGSLFVFIRHSKKVRMRVYGNSKLLLKARQPLQAIRKFIESVIEVDLDKEVLSISKGAWKCVSKYLLDRAIDENVLNNSFRNMIKQKLTGPRIDWILQAIVYDREKSLKVFSNDILKDNFQPDYKKFAFILESIYNYIS
ncbi:MAG: hypothetical protein WKG06_03015 [Segetibacter sp.]